MFKRKIIYFVKVIKDNYIESTIQLLNELTNYIIQSDRTKPIKFFQIYNKFSNNYKNNFFKLDKFNRFIYVYR